MFDAATASRRAGGEGIALVALGGYGRGELCPGSDLDLMVVHDRRADEAGAVAEAVWYPIWDTGIHLGHSVRSIAEATAVVGDDIESSTALLDIRHLAGDELVTAELSNLVDDKWTGSLERSIEWLRNDAAARREKAGDLAFSVEPNLKVSGGGLRDAQVPTWIMRGTNTLGQEDLDLLEAAKSLLLDVRVALHRCSATVGDVLRLEEQDAVAATIGSADADELMTHVAGAARNVSWVLSECWMQAASQTGSKRRKRRGGGNHPEIDEGDGWVTTDPVAVLEQAGVAATGGNRLGRPLLGRLAADMPEPPTPWNDATRTAFVALLGAGRGAIDVIEALDQVGVWERFIPEWPVIRTRAQRTTHHRFTVDRHLLEAVANASELTERVSRPDLLVVGALLHDLGKGRGGDHTEIGVELAEVVAPRMGFSSGDTAVLATLVRHHLLLPEVATRRDITDTSTIEAVAEAVGSIEVLGLLTALTEADAQATGPSAWTDWKAGLVRTLVERVGAHLQGAASEQYGPMFPTVDQMLLLRAGTTTVQGDGRTLTVVAADRPRLFSRVTGALVLAGLNVISAAVTSSDGMALEEFTVAPAFASAELAESIEIDWVKVAGEVERAMAGRMAIAARVAERADTYRRRLRSADAAVRIRFDDTAEDATVVEVDAPDAVGLLYAITRALGDLDVDIRYARVETQTERVIDAFSIVDADGLPIIDEAFRGEIERAIRYAVTG